MIGFHLIMFRRLYAPLRTANFTTLTTKSSSNTFRRAIRTTHHLLPSLLPTPATRIAPVSRSHITYYFRNYYLQNYSTNSNNSSSSSNSKMGNLCNNGNSSQGNPPVDQTQPPAPPTTTKEPHYNSNSNSGTVASASKETSMEDLVETTVGKISDFPEGQMHEVELNDDHKALIVNQNGKLTAVGNKCTHYGAPLIKGYLGDGRVRCPWHGACFSVTTGDIEDFPGLDNLARYSVSVRGEDVVVTANKKDLKTGRCSFVQKCPVDVNTKDKVYVLIGGGPASVECAITLRQEGFDGRIILCSMEQVLPYDRPKLSKAMGISADDIKLRSESFYKEHNIELQLGKELSEVDPDSKCVSFTDGTNLNYDCLLLATGAKPRTLPVPGFEHVHLLRKPSQANEIASAAKDKRVVIIGTSFIGMEVATYLHNKASSVSCVGTSAVPFEKVFGVRIGKALQKLLEDKGIKFHLSAGVKEIVVENDKVTGLMLPSGEVVPADVIVAGVGVRPATDYLKEFPSSSLTVTPQGELVVDEHMKAADGVYAAGDIAKFPLPLIKDSISIGHWQIAHNHGRVAGRNMAGKEEAFNSIPYFWTVQSGKSLRCCGLALKWDDIIYNGNPEEFKFTAYFVNNDKVVAVVSLAMDPVVSMSAELMYQNKMPTPSQLRENPNLQSHV